MFMNTSKKNPFQHRFMSKVDRIIDKLNRTNGHSRDVMDIHELFSSHDGVECWSITDLDDGTVPEEDTTIIIVTAANGVIRNAAIEINNYENSFHLCTLVSISHFGETLPHNGNKSWTGTILSRHNRFFQVWSQKRCQEYAIHSGTGFDNIPDDEEVVCAVYIQESQPNIQSRRNEFLKYMGGKVFVSLYIFIHVPLTILMLLSFTLPV